jgi:hypothetical protein
MPLRYSFLALFTVGWLWGQLDQGTSFEGLQQRFSQTLTNNVPNAAFRARATGSPRIDHRFNDNNTFFARDNVDDGVIVAPRSVIEVDQQNDNFPCSTAVNGERSFS